MPAEFKSGMSRWKDTGVYLDGKPIGFLTFGELPIALKPTWVKDKVSPTSRPAAPNARVALVAAALLQVHRLSEGDRHRRSSKVKVIHVYGPKLSADDRRDGQGSAAKAAEGFMFRSAASRAARRFRASRRTSATARRPTRSPA